MPEANHVLKKTVVYDWALVALCLAAGILYNSWPLGYLLDSQTVHSSLASDLEKVGHPFYWLFIACDVITALCSVAAAIIIFKSRTRLSSPAALILSGGLLVFGLFTGIAALLPSQCTVTPILRCGAGIGNGLGLDAVTSGIAALGLFISLVSLAINYGKAGPKVRFSPAYFILIMWSASAILFVTLALSNHNARSSQNVLMILTGISIALIGLVVARDKDKL